jgi:hypothetical protein
MESGAEGPQQLVEREDEDAPLERRKPCTWQGLTDVGRRVTTARS